MIPAQEELHFLKDRRTPVSPVPLWFPPPTRTKRTQRERWLRGSKANGSSPRAQSINTVSRSADVRFSETAERFVLLMAVIKVRDNWPVCPLLPKGHAVSQKHPQLPHTHL